MISGVVLRTQPDARLISLAADGSEAAFEALVQRYRRALLGYCRRMLLSEARSEDVVQQVFLSAWEALHNGAEIREARGWLYRITHNQAVSALRVPGYDFVELSESLRASEAPESELERRLLMRETLAAVAALPELQREAILRTAIDGSSYDQVATALGLSHKAVRGLVYRARASVRTAVAALTPAPLVAWSAHHPRRGEGLTHRLGEMIAGGGSAGGAAATIKGATLLATSAVAVGGTLGGVIAGQPFGTTPAVHHHSRTHARSGVTPTTRASGHETRLVAARSGDATSPRVAFPAQAGAVTASRPVYAARRQTTASLQPSRLVALRSPTSGRSSSRLTSSPGEFPSTSSPTAGQPSTSVTPPSSSSATTGSGPGRRSGTAASGGQPASSSPSGSTDASGTPTGSADQGAAEQPQALTHAPLAASSDGYGRAQPGTGSTGSPGSAEAQASPSP